MVKAIDGHKYLTREGGLVIIKTDPDPTEFYKFVSRAEDGYPSFYGENGKYQPDEEEPRDLVFDVTEYLKSLEPKSSVESKEAQANVTAGAKYVPTVYDIRVVALDKAIDLARIRELRLRSEPELTPLVLSTAKSIAKYIETGEYEGVTRA